MTVTMRAATYARYSSDLQRPASIEDQVRRCRAEIASRGWSEVAAFSDREIAGTVAHRRPDYQRLLAAAKAKQFEVVVVDELSRLTRDSEELAGLRKRLQFWGVHLRTLDGLDTVASPQSAAPMMLAKSFVNEAELEANAHRSRRGLRIPMKAATRSEGKRPAIPIESGHFAGLGAKRRHGVVHLVSVVPDFPSADNGLLRFRMDSPFSVMVWALCTSRSRMASAMVGSPRYSCQLATGS